MEKEDVEIYREFEPKGTEDHCLGILFKSLDGSLSLVLGQADKKMVLFEKGVFFSDSLPSSFSEIHLDYESMALFWRSKKHGHRYDHGDTTRRDTGTRQISKNQDTDMTRIQHNTIK